MQAGLFCNSGVFSLHYSEFELMCYGSFPYSSVKAIDFNQVRLWAKL